jgi:uncharacterized protein
MDIKAIFDKYYHLNSKTYIFLEAHSRAVADKALRAAEKVRHLNPDVQFIEEAALLHDIGIFMVNAPKIGCIGPNDYIAHGYLGRELMDKEGYPRHALVCERHVGVGLTVADIEKYKLPIPKREMIPLTLEEKIVCWADKFFSKFPTKLNEEKPLDKVRKMVANYGDEQLKRFDEWNEMFG